MTLDQVPPKVKATIDAQVGDGKLQEIEYKKISDKKVYEAEFMDKHNQRFEIVVGEDGKLLRRQLTKQQPAPPKQPQPPAE